MSYTPKNTLYNWFKTNKKPTQEQFWAWMDSYWHKSELIPLNQIENLDAVLEQAVLQADSKYMSKITSAVTFVENDSTEPYQISFKAGKYYGTDNNGNKKAFLQQGDINETITSIQDPVMNGSIASFFYTAEDQLQQSVKLDFTDFKNSILSSANMGYKGYLKKTDNMSSGGWLPGLYKLIEIGSYTNLTPAVDQNGNSITIVAVDGKINDAVWNGTNWQASQTTLPVVPVVDGFTSDSIIDASSAKNAKKLFDLVKSGGARDWTLGAYKADEITRNLGLLWKAKNDVTSATPGNNANWEIYCPFPKSPGIFTSHATTLTIDIVANTITFRGVSTNKIVTNQGIFAIRAQTVDTSANSSYYVIVYNTSTTNARALTIYNNTTIPLGVDDYVLFYVLNLNLTIQDVFGAKAYTLINAGGTTVYPIKPVATADVLYNKTFSSWQDSRTSDEKFWLSKSIIDIEFYNVKENAVVTLYGIGKNVTTANSYLGFIYAEKGKPALFLYADEFNNALSMPYDSVIHSGVKTYYLRSGAKRESNTTIYGKVTIDWSQVPDGKRVVESNAGVANNSNISITTYKKSDTFNNPLGFIKFAKSMSFYDYFTAPTIESYSGPDGSGIPKAPYQDCREWSLKWDEFVSNPPAGYSVTKETLTTEVPTDTSVDGKLPIYGYTFMPNKLAPGDPTGNNAQTSPRIILNCSIHGFEKTPSFVVYEFMKQLFMNWKSHPFLEYLRFNVEFVVIPFANPHGWNAGNGAGTRKNFNQVDLNRNFPTFWGPEGTTATSTYSGPYSLSEIESQAIYTFMQEKITSNTILGIDFHNFHGVPQSDPKLYNMAWIVNLGSELGQSAANVLIKELSTKYKAKSSLITQTDDYFIGQSNNYNGPGYSGSAMKSLGSLHASTFEVAQNFRFNSKFKSHDSDALTFGLESFVNYLRVYLNEFIEEYNRTK